MTATTPLALTTTFSPPPACTTDTWYIEYVTGVYYYTTSISNSREGWYLSQGATDWSSSFPSGYKATTAFYYSPGVCPSGYSIADSTVLSIGSSSETRATCCPSFTAQLGDEMVWYLTNRCYSDNTDTNHVWTVTQGGTITSKTMSGGLNAKAVFVRWQETDFQTTATATTDSATSTGSTARKAVSSSGPLATATTATTDQSGPSQGGSSRAWIAWIAGPVIGVVVGCTLIALAATWYNRQLWRQKGPIGAELPVKPSTEPPHDMAELHQEPKVFEAPCKPPYPGPFELPTIQHR